MFSLRCHRVYSIDIYVYVKPETKTLIAPWKSATQKLNLGLLTSKISVTSSILNKTDGGGLYSNSRVEKTTGEKLKKVATEISMSTMYSMNPDPTVGQLPMATIPPTLLPVNQIPSQVSVVDVLMF